MRRWQFEAEAPKTGVEGKPEEKVLGRSERKPFKSRI